MGVYQTDDGGWVASSYRQWLPGIYADERAARIALQVGPSALSELWQRKGFSENGKPDGSTDYRLTHDDVREALRLKRAKSGDR